MKFCIADELLQVKSQNIIQFLLCCTYHTFLSCSCHTSLCYVLALNTVFVINYLHDVYGLR